MMTLRIIRIHLGYRFPDLFDLGNEAEATLFCSFFALSLDLGGCRLATSGGFDTALVSGVPIKAPVESRR
jgi:hypothetical protein